MISYKVKGIILAVIISLASIMMPFSVYADTLTTSNITYNVYLQDVVDSSNTTLVNKDYIYDIDFNFDQSYLGWVSVQMIISYTHATGDTRQLTLNRALYLNGSNVHTSIVLSSNFNGINGGPFLSMSISVNNSNVTPMADLSSLQDIIDLLQDIDDHISIDILGELQDIVANTSLANQYLGIISKLREYSVPIESLAFTASVLKFNNNLIENSNYTYSIYPIIAVKTRNYLYAVWSQQTTGEYYLIIGTDSIINTIARFNQYFEITNSNIISITPVYSSYYSYDFYLIKFSRTNNGYCYFRNIADVNLIPIYMGSINNKNVSTEFALQWGLTNQLLDDLHIIANGTNQSNNVANDLESEASEYSDIADDVIGVEEGLTSNFETEVNKIDLNTGLNVFGGNFMTSATWVRTQFDRLTENTPYGSLVVYGLTLGFALLMLGKVFL